VHIRAAATMAGLVARTLAFTSSPDVLAARSGYSGFRGSRDRWGAWAPLANAQCFGDALRSGFITGIVDYDRYGEWMTEDTVMQLAQAGEYFGPEGIAEYLAFATSDSPYFEDNFNYPLSLTSFRPRGGWDEEAGECVITVALWSRYSMSDITVPGRTVTFAGMMKLMFSPVDTGARIAIRRINIYYDVPFLTWFFGTATNTEGVRDYMCSTLDEQCPTAWEKSELSSVEECKDRLAALPVTTSAAAGVSVSGRSLGCRVLHASFAETNPENHCPHISFAPMEDPKGRVKCQNDTAVEPSELFSAEDFTFYHDYLNSMVQRNVLDPDRGYRVVEYGHPCRWGRDCPDNTFCQSGTCSPLAIESTIFDPF